MNRRNTIALTALLAITVTGGLNAQSGQDERRPAEAAGMTAHCPMMRAHAEGPVAALEHRDRLELTPEQVARLEAVREESARARDGTMAAMEAIHSQLAAVMNSVTFDESAVREAFARMGDLHADMAVNLLSARSRTRQILTSPQRARFSELMDEGSGVMGGMGMMGRMHGAPGAGGMTGMMGMRHCPMMGAGMRHGGSDHSGHEEGGPGGAR